MGDAAMTVPVVTALREANPGLRITVLTSPLFRPFFRDVEGLEFIDADFGGRHKGLIGIYRLRNDIAAVGVTHVADLHDTPRTRMLRRILRVTGARIAVIDDGRDEKRELTRKFRKVKHQLRPAVERYTDTVRELDFEFTDPVPAMNVKRAVPQEILNITGPKTGTWTGVAPFARHKGKIYPTNMTDELIGLLAGTYERVFVFGGGPYEKEFAEYMEQRHPGVVSVIGKLKLAAELDLISNLDAMVTMDSAVMHMASLTGVPAVSVWGATHRYAGFYGFGQDPADAIQTDIHCRPCSVHGNKPCMHKDYRCLTGITPHMIAGRVAAVVGRTGIEKALPANETVARKPKHAEKSSPEAPTAAKPSKAQRSKPAAKAAKPSTAKSPEKAPVKSAKTQAE